MTTPDDKHDSTAHSRIPPVNGAWIKMVTNLWDNPKIARLCELLQCVEALVIGSLYRLWSLADTHSTDGRLQFSAFALNRKVGVDGFAEAVEAVGWLEIGDGFVIVVRFDEHNGQSAKRRAQDASRAAKYRHSNQSADPVTPPSRSKRDDTVTQIRGRVEKSKSKNDKAESAGRSPPPLSDPSPPFDELEQYWNATLTVSHTMTDPRRKTLTTRWKDATFRNCWREAIDRISQSDFCRGLNERGWTAHLEWFLKPDSLTKIIEGKYDNPTNATRPAHANKAAIREQGNADSFAILRASIASGGSDGIATPDPGINAIGGNEERYTANTVRPGDVGCRSQYF